MAVVEVCDVCHAKEASKKFKVKMSRKGCYQRTGYGIRWTDMWQPYKTISICEDCAEKLLDIKSNKTFVKGGIVLVGNCIQSVYEEKDTPQLNEEVIDGKGSSTFIFKCI